MFYGTNPNFNHSLYKISRKYTSSYIHMDFDGWIVMPALNGKMECGRMTRRQELYHPLMCAPTNGDRLSLPQEASTPLSTPNPPTPSNTFNTPASVGSGSVVVGRSVGGWISILRRKATKAASSCAAGQSFHSRGMGVASNLVRLS